MRNQVKINALREDGVALPAVIGIMVVLSMLMLVALAIVSNNTPRARATQDKSAARSAALSGAKDFATRVIEKGDGYIDTFTSDADNPAVDADPNTPQCDGPGQSISSAAAGESRFCYRRIPTQQNSGRVKLEITGIAGIGDKKQEHKLVVEFAAGGGESLTKYSWFSDYNVNDPAIANADPAKTAECTSKYRWEGRRADCSRSTTMSATLTGRYHSNDWWEIFGDVTFASAPITNAGPPPHYLPYPGNNGKLLGSPITQVPLLKLPNNTSNLLKHALPKYNTDSNTNRPGCVYEGQTKIKIDDDEMEVSSPNTGQGPNPKTWPAHCPAPGTKGPIPPLVYVKRASNTGACTAQKATGFQHPDEAPQTGNLKINYDGCLGTLAVEGEIENKSVTFYAEDDAIITDDLEVENINDAGNKDVIGIVAKGYVWVYNPIRADNSFIKNSGTRKIHASLTSLNHTILAQNLSQGPFRGEIQSRGSMIMKYQALFGASNQHGNFSGGYRIMHQYDERLNNVAPPFYVKPESGQFGIIGISDVGGS